MDPSHSAPAPVAGPKEATATATAGGACRHLLDGPLRGRVVAEDEKDKDGGMNKQPEAGAAPAVPASSSASNKETKKSKGRLKKLMKKLYGIDAAKDVSGLVDQDEWLELQELWKRQQEQAAETRAPSTSRTTSEEQGAAPGSWRRTSSIRGCGPQIRRREGAGSQQQAPPPTTTTVDVADHRDLLFRLVGASGPSNENSSSGSGNRKRRLEPSGEGGTGVAGSKRSRASHERDDDDDDYSPRIPSFASVHNPALVDRAAVIELHCSAGQYEALVNGLGGATVNGSGSNDGGDKDEGSAGAAPSDEGGQGRGTGIQPLSSCLGVSTRWFPGLHHPKAASHGLLYAAPRVKKVSKRGHPTAPTNVLELHRALLDLAPSLAEMQSHGYPCLGDIPDEAVASKRKEEQAVPSTANDERLPLFDVAAAHEAVRRAAVTIDKDGPCPDHDAPYIATVDRHVDEDRNDKNGTKAFPRVCAIDCEMVETTLGRELARITLLELVEFDGSSGSDPVISTRLRMDQLVQPRGVVTDYLTQYSGITAQLLEAGPTVELVQVQAALLQFLSKNDVLVGHSLENDLHATRLVHPTVLDTALLFRASGASYKHSLRHLAANLLHRTIQAGNHCSREDAQAALDLAVQRAYKGPNYARHLIRPRPLNLLTRQSQSSTVVCVGPHDWLQEHVESRSTLHALSCDSLLHPNRKALAAWLTSSNPSRRARLAYGCWTLDRETKDTSDSGGDDAVSNDSAVTNTIALVQKLRSQLPASALMCVTVQAEFRNALRLTEQRKVRLNPKSTVRWTEDEEVKWARLVNHCRTGMVYWMTGVNSEEQESV